MGTSATGGCGAEKPVGVTGAAVADASTQHTGCGVQHVVATGAAQATGAAWAAGAAYVMLCVQQAVC